MLVWISSTKAIESEKAISKTDDLYQLYTADHS